MLIELNIIPTWCKWQMGCILMIIQRYVQLCDLKLWHLQIKDNNHYYGNALTTQQMLVWNVEHYRACSYRSH